MSTTLEVAIAEFNWSLLNTMHPSQLAVFEQEPWWQTIAVDHRFTAIVDQYLLNSLALSHCPDYDFQQPLKRIALLDHESILQWLLAIGVTLHSHTIKQTIWRQQQLLIKEQIGEQWYQFALTNGLFLYHQPIASIDQWLTELTINEHYCEQLLIVGLAVWQACLENSTDGWWQRLQLKLPISLSLEKFSPFPELGEQLITLSKMLEKLIHQVCPHVFDH
ncbi:SctK family type III secretion system sorting platform protein [Endozoicomonas sp. SM1973]|uniref:SctK family type III secretion system sorting platform protein n=1 Tax=Spartinivicinus marinus TaxID=2994442 RepID=A0A853I6M2_9GAMM|nr:SctK family type III secretion system sorting platform protein [Spartinivicinus marinus]MCX4024655.1 SctK family type III secretion system sorting platform protein [Spartinivicinus marinus]NYZ66318.1 SctK family type III secretion system sorting platform protein [Spartinivicinus marinus]